MHDLTEVKTRADILAVWSAIGGGELRHGRGRAAWRNGDGYNVAFDRQRGLWFDHAQGVGGDVVTLVMTALGCDFKTAIAWLANFTGVATPSRNDTRESTNVRGFDHDRAADLEQADAWAISITMFAEWALEDLAFNDSLRPELTRLLREIRRDDESLLREYRSWRSSHPEMTAAMVRAGQRLDVHRQCEAARRLREVYGPATA